MAVSLILTRHEMQATKKADIYRGVTPAAARGEPAAGVAGVVVAERCGSGVGRCRRCDLHHDVISRFIQSSSIKPGSIFFHRIFHHSFRWRRFQPLRSMSWVISVPSLQAPRQILMELLIFDVHVVFEGRLEVLVDISGGLRVISIVVRTESHKGLQIGKKFLRKTIDGCSVFESLGMGDVLFNANVISVANCRAYSCIF
jgi:hypothetical protein